MTEEEMVEAALDAVRGVLFARFPELEGADLGYNAETYLERGVTEFIANGIDVAAGLD